MKRQHLFIICFGTIAPNIFSAAFNEREVKEAFESAKTAIANDLPDALLGLTPLMMCAHEEEVKQLLDYALRNKGTYGPAYVVLLTQHLEKQANRFSLKTGRRRSALLFRTGSLTPLDVAIMTGNVDNVQLLISLNPALLSKSLLIRTSGGEQISVQETVEKLIELKKRQGYSDATPKIEATLEQLEQIKKIVADHLARKVSLLTRAKRLFS